LALCGLALGFADTETIAKLVKFNQFKKTYN